MAHGVPTPTDDNDTSPASLWDAARYALRWLVSLFGAPTEIAQLSVLAPRERADMLASLRTLEALVRALLLINAASVAQEPPPSRSRTKARKRVPHIVEQDPETSERWRVSFRALASLPGPPSKPCLSGTDLPNAWPIAERLEAVIRVLENPAPFARRLAARLRARPEDARRLLSQPPTQPSRRPGAWALQEARRQALSAIAAFDSS